MANDCEYCGFANHPLKIYEDRAFVVLLHPAAAIHGHMLIVPKGHYQIIEQVPESEIGGIFQLANKVSASLFESLNIQGTNILVQNGIPAGQSQPHFCLHVIPRRENDKLKLEWQPRQLNEEEMSTVELHLKEHMSQKVITNPTEDEKPLNLDEKPKVISGDEANYLLRSLRRVP